MDLIDLALPVGWLLVGAGGMLLGQRLFRDRGVERLSGAIERQQRVIEARVDQVLAGAEQRIVAEFRDRDREALAAVESRMAALVAAIPPQPLEDDTSARLHARRRRVAPDLFAAVRDLHRTLGDLVDEPHGWPADVDPPDPWEAVDVARARLHAIFTRCRIHLPTPLDALVAEYRRVVGECLKSQRAAEQLQETRPQAARFSADRARSLLRTADEHFRRIEDALRGIMEEDVIDADGPKSAEAASRRAALAGPGETAGADPAVGIRPTSKPSPATGTPTIMFPGDLLDPDDSGAPITDGRAPRDEDDDEDDDDAPSRNGGRRPTNGDPNDTLRPRD